MVITKKLDEYRQKLDRLLLADSLVDEDKLRALVKKQILCSDDDQQQGSIEKLVNKRTGQVSDFLDMLRSGSENYVPPPHMSYASWKVTQDNETFRSMYREGPQGTSILTVSLEGHLDAPLDACLHVTSETSAYPTAFPESRFHKVTEEYFKKLGLSEQLSLMRIKVPWPLTRRELLLHFFVLECFEEGLMFVLINSISGKEDFCKETDGFSNEEIPKPVKAVRVDLMGGIAFQKVSETKSFMRLILNMDLKLNFVPQTAINFISGKLTGTAFKFYEKWVTSVAKEEEKTKDNPSCQRIRDALYPSRSSNKVTEPSLLLRDDSQLHDDGDDGSSSVYESVIGWDDSIDSDEGDDSKSLDISKTENDCKSLEDNKKAKMDERQIHQTDADYLNKNKAQLVGQTLGTLEQAISAMRDGSPRIVSNESRQLLVETQEVILKKAAVSASSNCNVMKKASLEYSSIINLNNFRSTRPNSNTKENNPAPSERNQFYTHDRDLVASYIIQSKGAHQNQQQIFVVDANYAPKGEKKWRKKSRKLKNWALSCIHPAPGQASLRIEN